MKKVIGLSVLTVVVVEILTTFLRFQSLATDFWISYILFFFIARLFFIRYPERKGAIILSSIFTFISLTLIAWIFDGAFPWYGTPNWIACIISILLSYAFLTKRTMLVRSSIIIFSLALCTWYPLYGLSRLETYINADTGRQK